MDFIHTITDLILEGLLLGWILINSALGNKETAITALGLYGLYFTNSSTVAK